LPLLFDPEPRDPQAVGGPVCIEEGRPPLTEGEPRSRVADRKDFRVSPKIRSTSCDRTGGEIPRECSQIVPGEKWLSGRRQADELLTFEALPRPRALEMCGADGRIQRRVLRLAMRAARSTGFGIPGKAIRLPSGSSIRSRTLRPAPTRSTKITRAGAVCSQGLAVVRSPNEVIQFIAIFCSIFGQPDLSLGFGGGSALRSHALDVTPPPLPELLLDLRPAPPRSPECDE
jgi:hypothetical protein